MNNTSYFSPLGMNPSTLLAAIFTLVLTKKNQFI